MASDTPTLTFVDSTTAISSLIDQLSQLQTVPTPLFVDLEGRNLCRHGTISLLTLFIESSAATKHAYIIDIHHLGHEAFNTPGKDSNTLKTILEDPAIPKVFFDVRNDSDALHAHFNIALRGVQDVQLMENAARGMASKRYLSGLANCIRFDAGLDFPTKNKWEVDAARGKQLFAPEEGGSYEVFDQRPLSEGITAYCVGDVRYLPRLHGIYLRRLTGDWKRKVEDETGRRVLESQGLDYQPNGAGKALGPWLDKQSGVVRMGI